MIGSVLVDTWKLYRQFKSPVTVCNELDSKYPIPRPADAPFLPPYQAVMTLLGIITKMGMVAFSGIVSLVGFSLAFRWLELPLFSEVGAIFLFIQLGVALIAFSEARQQTFIYLRTQQRVSQGTGMFAEREMMEDSGVLYEVGSNQDSGTLPLGRYGQEEIGLPWEYSSCHTILFGPTGAGKSKTFFMNMLKRWSGKDSAIVIDPKGELMWQTGRQFKRVYRFNLIDPTNSDRWNFIPDCRDATVAAEVASIILQIEPTKGGGGAGDMGNFWEKAEMLALRAMLMFLSVQKDERGNPMTPADIQRLIATPEDFASPEQIAKAEEQLAARTAPGQTLKVTLLNLMMQSVPGEIGASIRESWGMFTTIKQEGHANVLIGIGVVVGSFSTPVARALAQPIGSAQNSRWISFKELRKPGTVIYLIVQEGDTGMYQTVLTTFLGMAVQALRRTTEKDGSAKVLCLFDEAGNIPIWGLKEMLGLGRGRGIPMVLCYQDINQIYSQYGENDGKAVVGLATNFVFLPGLKSETAQFAVELLGKATVWSHTSVDAKGSQNDNERASETGRELMMASEVRQLVRHRQAIGVFASLPPVKFSYPPFAFNEKLPKYNVSVREEEFFELPTHRVERHLGDPPPDDVIERAIDVAPMDFLSVVGSAETARPKPRIVKVVKPVVTGEAVDVEEESGFEDEPVDVYEESKLQPLSEPAAEDDMSLDDRLDFFSVIDAIEKETK